MNSMEDSKDISASTGYANPIPKVMPQRQKFTHQELGLTALYGADMAMAQQLYVGNSKVSALVDRFLRYL